jgi:hypothetical protein
VSGRVGVGTNNPNQQLQIYGNSSNFFSFSPTEADDTSIVDNTNFGATSFKKQMTMRLNNRNWYWGIVNDASNYLGLGADGGGGNDPDVQCVFQNDGTFFTKYLRVKENVGIGTTNPSATLDVNGVTKNQNPSWNLYFVGSGTNATSGTLSFNTIRASARNCTLNTSGGVTSRITITVAGRYFIGFQAFTESSVSIGSTVEYFVRINGGDYVRNYHKQPYANYSAMGGLGCLADLSVNDYIELYVAQGTVHGNENASFYGFMIG